MGEFLKRISKGGPVAYGRTEVKNAGECGAIEEILVVDTLIRDPEIVMIMDQVERSDARVVVFSTGFEPGKRLDALGGVAALLRYRIG
ncbi:MAG: mRNA surveillance protein Pelota, partial [Methanomicrobiales archaeon]